MPDAAATIARFKRDSPWAFAQTSSSHPAPAPAAAAPEVKSAMLMTHDEWRAARAAILKNA